MPNDPNLLIVCDNESFGGIDRYLYQIKETLEKEAEVQTINLNEKITLFNFSFKLKVKFWDKKETSILKYFFRFIESILNLPIALFISLTLLNKKKTLLFVNGGYPGSIFLLEIFLFSGLWNLKPSLLILSTPKIREYKKIPNIFNKTLNYLVDKFSFRLLTNSEAAKKELVENLGFPSKKIIVAKGFSFIKFEVPIIKKDLQILFFARVEKDKGVYDFLEVYSKLTAKGYSDKIQWILAGDGSEKSQLGSFENRKNLKILGFVPERDVPKLLQETSIIVFPSYFEGLPYSLLEGAAAGCVLIGYDVGGVSEILKDGYNGFLIKKGDKDTLSKKVEFLINSQDLIGKMSKNSLLFSEKSFSKDLFRKSFLELLHEN